VSLFGTKLRWVAEPYRFLPSISTRSEVSVSRPVIRSILLSYKLRTFSERKGVSESILTIKLCCSDMSSTTLSRPFSEGTHGSPHLINQSVSIIKAIFDLASIPIRLESIKSLKKKRSAEIFQIFQFALKMAKWQIARFFWKLYESLGFPYSRRLILSSYS